MIHILQCLCPARRCITAVMYDDAGLAPTEALDGFKGLMELAIERCVLNPRCAICGKDVSFHYVDAITSFKTIEEARPFAKQAEAAQLAARKLFESMRN